MRVGFLGIRNVMVDTFPAGEEVGAVVIEFGTWYIRIGFAGDDNPKLFVRNIYGTVAKDEQQLQRNTESVLCNDNGMQDIERSKDDKMVVEKQEPQQVEFDNSATKEETLSTEGVTTVEDTASEEKSVIEKKYRFYYDQKPSFPKQSEKEWKLSKLVQQDGFIGNWDALLQLFKEVFEYFCIKPEEYAIMFVECASGLNEETRKYLSKIAFEDVHVPAIFILNSATAAAFSCGRTTALVVSVGHSGSIVVPVVEGFSLKRSTLRNDIGGHVISQLVRQYCDHYFQVSTQEKEENRTTEFKNAGWIGLEKEKVIEDIKHSVCGFWDEEEHKLVDVKGHPVETLTYELADHRFIRISRELARKIPLVLLDPSLLNEEPLSTLYKRDHDLSNIDSKHLFDVCGVCQLVLDAVMKCDPDNRRDLLGNVILVGGSTLFAGFTKVFRRMLLEKTPHMYRLDVFSPMLAEEVYSCSWIGGSILASLGTFQHFWFSFKEYQEKGANYILEKWI
eukprot:jgi/Galph1/4359/GphlegSOOS_G2954.1